MEPRAIAISMNTPMILSPFIYQVSLLFKYPRIAAVASSFIKLIWNCSQTHRPLLWNLLYASYCLQLWAAVPFCTRAKSAFPTSNAARCASTPSSAWISSGKHNICTSLPLPFNA